MDLRDRLPVVNRRVQADPQLCEVDADNLVRDLGSPDVRAEIAHAWNGTQLTAGSEGDARHRLERGAGLLDPVHQEVVFLEVREELLAEQRECRRGDDQGYRQDAECPPGRRDQTRQPPPVMRLEVRDQR